MRQFTVLNFCYNCYSEAFHAEGKEQLRDWTEAVGDELLLHDYLRLQHYAFKQSTGTLTAAVEFTRRRSLILGYGPTTRWYRRQTLIPSCIQRMGATAVVAQPGGTHVRRYREGAWRGHDVGRHSKPNCAHERNPARGRRRHAQVVRGDASTVATRE